MAETLAFKNGNPGAVQYGNFINYYQFHSVEERVRLLPQISTFKQGDTCCALDLGCNSGDLTVRLHDLLKKSYRGKCYTLGVDIDPTLIQRAKENSNGASIEFMNLDFMNASHRQEISNHVASSSGKQFNVVFCFSVTMWIHLNHGDEGLKLFLEEICKLGEFIVIETQPWHCYKKAVKRMKVAKSEFPLYSKLKMRNNVEEDIEKFLTQNCNSQKIFESERTAWGRKILIYETNC